MCGLCSSLKCQHQYKHKRKHKHKRKAQQRQAADGPQQHCWAVIWWGCLVIFNHPPISGSFNMQTIDQTSQTSTGNALLQTQDFNVEALEARFEMEAMHPIGNQDVKVTCSCEW